MDATGKPFVFQGGQKYHVWMLFSQGTSAWGATLKWSRNSTAKQLIPTTRVYANVPSVGP